MPCKKRASAEHGSESGYPKKMGFSQEKIDDKHDFLGIIFRFQENPQLEVLFRFISSEEVVS
jgi:hypothetical protein